jgi:quercetin dioxygenase-like cupin family protein
MLEGLVVEKVWGREVYVTSMPGYTGKFLHVSPGFACSIHRHPIKTESFHVMSGQGVIGVDGRLQKVKVGDTVHIPQNTFHFFAAVEEMTLLEISTHHEDSDVDRASPSRPLIWQKDATMLRLLGVPESESSQR